jgi:hypothetical protein
MPTWIAALIALLRGRAKTVPWLAAFEAARWLFGQGRDRLNENLSDRERSELWGLLRKSKGRRSNLTDRDWTRFKNLVKKGLTGK